MDVAGSEGVKVEGKLPLDFEMWHFLINFLVEKCFSVCFYLVK